MSAPRIPDAAFRYYAYDPNFVLPIVCAVLFFVAFVVHSVIMVRTKSWYMWPFVLGALGETVGYILRRISAMHPVGRQAGLVWYLSQRSVSPDPLVDALELIWVPFDRDSLFIILAPALMAATHYMVFGRIITYVGEKYSPVRAKWVTLIFVIFDVISFVVQGGGGSLFSSNNPALYGTAKAILIAGFLIQIISFGIFLIFAIIYQIRAKKGGVEAGNWTKCLYTLYAGCAMILLRGIFRTIEFGSGNNSRGYFLDNEGWYYGLETLPILICVYLFLFSHPSRYIPSDRKVRLHPEEVIPPIGANHEAKRSQEDDQEWKSVEV